MVLWRETIWGVDTDEVFAYSTKKVVWIRDRWIGVFYYAIVFLVLLWVVGGQILWRNEHFLRRDVEGVARMWISHPTENDCSPSIPGCKSAYRKLTDIPYCDVYRGPEQRHDHQAHCEYRDRISMLDGVSRVQSVFIPTAVEIVEERQNCNPSAENGYSCDNTYETLPGSDCLHPNELCRSRGGKKDQFYYVADVLNYRIQFTSSYERDDIRGTSLLHQGYVGICRPLLELSNSTRTWSAREKEAKKHHCDEKHLEKVKIACPEGVDCAEMRAFDILEDTGINVAGRDLKYVVGVGDDPEEDKLEDKLEDIYRSQTSLLAINLNRGRKRRLRHNGHASPDRNHSVTVTPEVLNRGRGMISDARWIEQKMQGELAVNVSGFDQYSNNWGDVFKVKRLLALAGADLDSDYNMDGWTTRQAGTVLEVEAVYNNLYPFLSSFGYHPVSYYYTVRQLTLPYVSHVKLSDIQPEDFPRSRRHEVHHGLLVYFRVSGTFGFFNIVYLMVMLTTALALAASATTLTDMLALHVHPRRNNFFHLKYEVSPDFSDTWRCSDCGFYNQRQHEACMGATKFRHPEEAERCNGRRPQALPPPERAAK